LLPQKLILTAGNHVLCSLVTPGAIENRCCFNYKHDDFEVVLTDNMFGSFEELRDKEQNDRVSSHSLDLLILIGIPYRTHSSSEIP
jgi:hypothetical protein